MTERVLLMDASCRGLLRLGFAAQGQVPSGGNLCVYRADTMPTLTDALIRFEQDSGTSLLGVTAALAVGGAVTGDVVPIARSRWIISRSGLASMFGRPVVVVNDVAACAWATLQGLKVRDHLHGRSNPAVTAAGRIALLSLGDGVGAAIVNVDSQSRTTVIESEAGHMDFTPAGLDEERLVRSLSMPGEGVSWEQVLLAVLEGDAQGTIDLALAGRLAGRFAGNTALAFGAWQGVMLAGRHVATFGRPAARTAFAQAFCMRASFRRQLGAAPCCTIDQHEPVLSGLAAMLASHRQPEQRMQANGVTSRSAYASGLR